jgi:YD repeat-containing protein
MMVRLARDAAGNMIAQGTCSTSVPSSNQYSYTYDAENHLVSETTASGANNCQNVTTSYTYDGDGNRVEKSSGTIYWYGSGGDALDESNLSGSITNEYIFFGGARIARRVAQPLNLRAGGPAFEVMVAHLSRRARKMGLLRSSPPPLMRAHDFYSNSNSLNILDTPVLVC